MKVSIGCEASTLDTFSVNTNGESGNHSGKRARFKKSPGSQLFGGSRQSFFVPLQVVCGHTTLMRSEVIFDQRCGRTSLADLSRDMKLVRTKQKT